MLGVQTLTTLGQREPLINYRFAQANTRWFLEFHDAVSIQSVFVNSKGSMARFSPFLALSPLSRRTSGL